MKNTTVLIVLLCLVHNATAQLSFGVRSSYSLVSASEATKELSRVEPIEIYNFSYLKSSNHFSYGLIVHDQNEKVFASAELLYKKSKHEFQIENVIEKLKRGEATNNFSYEHVDISLPVAAGIKISKFKLGAGPILNYRISSQNSLQGNDSVRSEDPKFNMGFQLMAGFMVNKHIHVDLKREMSFNRVGSNYKYLGEPVKLNSSAHAFSLSIGIFI